jgi:hypothetical protein
MLFVAVVENAGYVKYANAGGSDDGDDDDTDDKY